MQYSDKYPEKKYLKIYLCVCVRVYVCDIKFTSVNKLYIFYVFIYAEIRC